MVGWSSNPGLGKQGSQGLPRRRDRMRWEARKDGGDWSDSFHREDLSVTDGHTPRQKRPGSLPCGRTRLPEGGTRMGVGGLCTKYFPCMHLLCAAGRDQGTQSVLVAAAVASAGSVRIPLTIAPIVWRLSDSLACEFFLFVFCFWLHLRACRILAPQPGIEPVPPCSGSTES